jgi:hypothetical protein
VTKTTKKYLTWVQYEAVEFDSLLGFIRRRLDEAPAGNEYQYYRTWLQDQLKNNTEQRVQLDKDQNYLLLQEFAKYSTPPQSPPHDIGYACSLTRAADFSHRTEKLLEQILEVFHLDSQLDAEKVALAVTRHTAPNDSAEALDALERMNRLKQRWQCRRRGWTSLPRYSQAAKTARGHDAGNRARAGSQVRRGGSLHGRGSLVHR